MLWYVLQTKTGGEEKLVEMIRRIVPRHLYGECFVVYHEQLWRRQQKNFVHVKRAFPGYVFITSREPEALFFCLKKIPAMTKMMADEESFFLFLEPEEQEFLKQIMDERHVIGLSYLETDGKGNISQVSGPLKSCVSRIIRCQFGKRYVIVRLRLLGKEKDVLLGIVLKEDICQEVRYGKVEAPIKVPKPYKMEPISRVNKKADRMNALTGQANMRTDKEKRNPENAENPGKIEKIKKIENPEKIEKTKKTQGTERFSTGDSIMVTDGVFCGMVGMVYQVKHKTVKIGIRLFERNMEIEMPLEILRKN